jgi:hypothetical protein
MYDFAMYILFEIEYQKDIKTECLTVYDQQWKQGQINLLQNILKPLM